MCVPSRRLCLVPTHRMAMAFFHLRQVRITMSMAMATMAMTVFMKKEQSQNIRRKSKTSHYQHQLRLGHHLWLDETLYGFQED